MDTKRWMKKKMGGENNEYQLYASISFVLYDWNSRVQLPSPVAPDRRLQKK